MVITTHPNISSGNCFEPPEILFPTLCLSFTAMKVFDQVMSERIKHEASHR